MKGSLLAGFGLLMLVALGSVGLTGLQTLTAPAVEAGRAAQTRALLERVLRGVKYDNAVWLDHVEWTSTPLPGAAPAQSRRSGRFYRAREGPEIVATAVVIDTPPAYSDRIRLLIAIDNAGAILASDVIAHRETPGLGDRVEPRRTPWLTQFDGEGLSPAGDSGDSGDRRFRLVPDGGAFDAISGATVTARAAMAGIREALHLVQAHRGAIAAAPRGGTIEVGPGGVTNRLPGEGSPGQHERLRGS